MNVTLHRHANPHVIFSRDYWLCRLYDRIDRFYDRIVRFFGGRP